MDRKKILVPIFIILAIASFSLFIAKYQSLQKQQNIVSPEINPLPIVINHAPCLAEGEVAGFTIAPRNKVEQFEDKSGIVTVIVGFVGDSKKNRNLFDIDTFQYDFAHPVETHTCHIYTIQTVNQFDYKNYRFLAPHGTISLFRYDYSGKKEKVLDFVEGNGEGKAIFNFSYDFAIDDSETHIALVSPYPDEDRHLVVKNMKTGEVLFTAGALDLAKQYHVSPGIGDIDEMYWNDKSNYLSFQLAGSDASFWLNKKTWTMRCVWSDAGLSFGDKKICYNL